MQIHRTWLFRALVFVLAAVFAALIWCGPSQAEEDSLVIKGRLVRADGAPAGDVWLMLYFLNDGKAAIKIKDGKVQNPSATTDDQGRFSMKLIPGLFPEAESFALAANVNQRDYPLVGKDGAKVILKFEKPYKEVDLGEIKLMME